MKKMKLSTTDRRFKIVMESQTVELRASVVEAGDDLDIRIAYTHPSTEEYRATQRKPRLRSFSQKYFEKELDAYIVQEAMSDLMDNRHSYDWIE